MTLIGLKRQLKELRSFIVNYAKLKTKVAVLWGSCGVGKTSSVYHVANELGYRVVEFNASDNRTYDFFVEHIKPVCCNHSLTPTVVLLDEFEDVSKKAQQFFAKIMKRFVKPVIITTNDASSIIYQIRKKAAMIYYPKPSIESIVKFAKQRGYNNFNRAKDIADFRQLEMLIAHESDVEIYNGTKTQKERILKSLRTGNYDTIEKSDLPILIDTVSANASGVDLWRFIESLRIYDITERAECLNGIKINAKNIIDSFYTKLVEQKRR